MKIITRNKPIKPFKHLYMKKWTKKEDDQLKKLVASEESTQDIYLKMGLSKYLVEKRILELGLEKPEQSFNPERIVDISIKKDSEKTLKKQVDILTKELITTRKERDAFLYVGEVETYKIEPKKKTNGRSMATAITLASDWHIEEEVKSSQVNGLNKFNIDIAKERAEKYFKVVAQLIEVHNKEYQIDDLILALLGDFISGTIHDDLKEANNIQPTEAIWNAQKLIASGIRYLLDNTKVNLIIPCSSGNHGRITAKQRTSTEYGNSLEILMYKQLKDFFHNEKELSLL